MVSSKVIGSRHDVGGAPTLVAEVAGDLVRPPVGRSSELSQTAIQHVGHERRCCGDADLSLRGSPSSIADPQYATIGCT
jgi:hypothetical protein